MTSRWRCAAASRLREDPLAATAPPVQRWLAIEHPGPWPRNAVDALPIAPATRRLLTGADRLLLIRPSGRQTQPLGPPWTLYVADSSPGRPRLQRWTGVSVDAVVRAALAAPGGGAAAASVETTPSDMTTPAEHISVADVDGPLVLVCCHGRHDTCCAMDGRPVARELTARDEGLVRECSHLGGDRFAANVVLLPEGLVYGRVNTDNAAPILAEYRAGRVVPELLRGISTQPAPVQAAQAVLRAQGIGMRIDDLSPIRVEALGGNTWDVTVTGCAGEHRVCVGLEDVELGTPATCHATSTGRGRVIRVLSTDEGHRHD